MTQHTADCAASLSAAPRTGKKRLGFLLGSLVLVAACIAIRYYWGAGTASADPPGWVASSAGDNANTPQRQGSQPARSNTAAAPANRSSSTGSSAAEGASAPQLPEVVATVNTKRILRDDFQWECLRHSGKEVLESMVNKRLIMQECQKQGITITKAEVNAEIARLAKQFGIPVNQWLTMLKQERNVTQSQYENDIIWPTLALRKLAGGRLSVSRDELAREYETQFGEAVRARLIAVTDLAKAKKLQAEAAAKPEEFGNLAKDHSEAPARPITAWSSRFTDVGTIRKSRMPCSA